MTFFMTQYVHRLMTPFHVLEHPAEQENCIELRHIKNDVGPKAGIAKLAEISQDSLLEKNGQIIVIIVYSHI